MFRIRIAFDSNPRSHTKKINNVCFCLQFFGLKTAQARVVKHIFYTICTEYTGEPYLEWTEKKAQKIIITHNNIFPEASNVCCLAYIIVYSVLLARWVFVVIRYNCAHGMCSSITGFFFCFYSDILNISYRY